MFFQAVLLAGYGYAHISATRAGIARQIAVHLAILAAACVVLPIAIPREWAPSPEGSPLGALLLLAPDLRRSPVFRPFGYRAPASAVVRPDRTSFGRGPLFSVQREQPRQHAGLDRLPHMGGAPFPACRAEPRMDRRLLRYPAPHHPVCGRPVEMPVGLSARRPAGRGRMRRGRAPPPPR